MAFQGLVTGLQNHRRAMWALAMVAALLPASAATAAIRILNIGYEQRVLLDSSTGQWYDRQETLVPPIVPLWDEETGVETGEWQFGSLYEVQKNNGCNDTACFT